jgi:cell division protein FtsB
MGGVIIKVDLDDLDRLEERLRADMDVLLERVAKLEEENATMRRRLEQIDWSRVRPATGRRP